MNKTAKCYKCGSGKKTRKSRKIKCRKGFPKTENIKVFNQICQNNTTKAEMAGSGKYNQKKYLKNFVKGTYICSCCGNNLFRSSDIYDSGTGWPSFSKSYNIKSTVFHKDSKEITCRKCGLHLGHKFNDKFSLTGKRFCINSACLFLKS